MKLQSSSDSSSDVVKNQTVIGGRGATFGTVFSAHAGTEWRTISYPNKLISRWFPMGYEPSGLQFQARLEMVSYCLQTVDFSE